MTLNITNPGGPYQTFVAEDNATVYVSWTISNDVIRTDDDFPYTFYRYPRENRLTQVTYPDGTITQYQYDRRNNMVSTTTIIGTNSETTAMTYDIENRLLQSGDKTFEYDNNGNQILGDTNYRYYSTFLDGYKVNWLISVGTIGGGGGGDEQQSVGGEPVTMSSISPSEPQDETIPATSYGYALNGRRVGKAGAADMKYLYDGENVVYELWDHMTVRFTHPVASGAGCGSGACGAGSCDIFFTDHPISITIYDENGVATKYYYLYDGLGSVTELIDVNENVVNFYRYTPFGEALIREEQVYNPHQFTGRQYDAESGLYHYRARAYSSGIGRFMQQDPAGMVDGANMYAYVGNNPVNGVDPTGMSLCTWKCGLLATLAGVAICVFLVNAICTAFAVNKLVCNFLLGSACAFAFGAATSYFCQQRCRGTSDSTFCNWGCQSIFANTMIGFAVLIGLLSQSPWIPALLNTLAFPTCYVLCKVFL